MRGSGRLIRVLISFGLGCAPLSPNFPHRPLGNTGAEYARRSARQADIERVMSLAATLLIVMPQQFSGCLRLPEMLLDAVLINYFINGPKEAVALSFSAAGDY